MTETANLEALTRDLALNVMLCTDSEEAIRLVESFVRAHSVSRPAVKGLQWKENSANSIWTGELAFGAYYTAYDEGDGWRLFRGQFLSSCGDHELAFGLKAVVLAAAQSDFEQRILSSLSPPTGGATPRHVKRGSEYELIGIGRMQAEKWRDLPAGGAPVDMREIAIYRSIDDDSLWARPLEEFRDGRFVALTKKEGQ